jgi:ArsR family transcriptional regulator, arsenate/arsenite/antimonite-responsive transcriptional repressor / arsenate reductase (thioredoxin)
MMETKNAALAFATLGHPDRLAVFRMLMRFVPRGVRPTEIAQALGYKQNTLSHHLSDLTAAGLVAVRRQGRSLFYSVDLDTAEALIGHLALDIARGRPDMLGALLSARDGDGTMQRDAPLNVLFLCSGNSARSILAEALLRDLGKGRFHAFSAGTRPSGGVHPMTLELLGQKGHGTTGLRSKHVDEFRSPGAVVMDIVLTVCDAAAAEDCPRWTGQPITSHWGLPDPTQAPEGDRMQAFERTYAALRHRILRLVGLPVETLGRTARQSRVDALSAVTDAEA